MKTDKIVVIEDEEDILEVIAYNLKREGFDVTTSTSGEDGLAKIERSAPNLVILDLMLPEIDGLDLCRKLKADPVTQGVPIIMVTAKGEESDVVLGLGMGADDYMVKPFSLAELSARLRALMRRGHPHESTLHVADLEMDVVRRSVRRAGRSIDLKPKEYALLEFLMRHSDRPVTRSLIIEHVWDIHFDSISNVVEVHINSLRNKIDRGFAVSLIHTIRGVGYMLAAAPP